MRRLALVPLAALALMGGCNPTVGQQQRWANHACRGHGGVRSFDDADSGGAGGGPANVVCRSGLYRAMNQRTQDRMLSD